MNAWLLLSRMTASGLLAQVLPSRKLAAGFRDSGFRFDWANLWPLALLAPTAAIVAAVVMVRRRRNDMTQRCDDPRKLFRELCLAHQLDRRSERLLQQLAAALGFAQPAEVFLSPKAFAADELPTALRDKSEQLQQLRLRLF